MNINVAVRRAVDGVYSAVLPDRTLHTLDIESLATKLCEIGISFTDVDIWTAENLEIDDVIKLSRIFRVMG